VLRQCLALEPFEIEPLTPRQDGDRHFADFGRREDEFHMRWRLFQRLEQRIERGRRQHVHFVNDVDLVARRYGRVAHAVEQLAHVRNTSPGSRVEFQHIRVIPCHDRRAEVARRIEIHARRVVAVARIVERARQQPRRRGLADAAHAGQHEGVRHATGLKRILQRPNHGFLANQIRKQARTVLARKYLITFILWHAHFGVAKHGKGRVIALIVFRGFGRLAHG